MSEVSCRICAPILDAFEDAGLPPSAIVEGLPFAPETLMRPSNRIRWDEFTVILENAARHLGGPEGLEEAAACYYERAGSLLGAIAANVSSARPLYHMGARWYGPSLFSATRAVCEETSDGRIRQTIEILPEFKACPLFFVTMRGALRGTPTLLGQDRALVEMESEDERRAVFLITPPPSLTLWARLRRALFPDRDLDRASEEGEAQRDELQHGYDVARRATELLSFQAARLDAQQHELHQAQDVARRTTELLSFQSARREAEQREQTGAEQLLLQVQKLETIGRLTGEVAHDVDSALTVILEHVEGALGRVDRDDPLRSELGEIRSAAESGSAHLRKLLAVGRPEAVTPRRVVLNDVLLSLEPMLRQVLPNAIQVAVLPAPEPLEVVADLGQLEQVVLNLALNARDAMPDGGRLDIELRRAGAEEARAAGATGHGDFARLEVRDTGSGMPAETLARALEPFYTTKAPGQGSGLGLASVHAIVQRAGGAIRIESEVGKGTLVVILHPLAS